MGFDQGLKSKFIQMNRSSIERGSILSFEKTSSLLAEEIGIPLTIINNNEDLKKWHSEIIEGRLLFNLIKSDEISEIIIHSPAKVQQINYNGEIELKGLTLTVDDYWLAIKALNLKNHIDWNYQSPFKTFNINREESNYRISVVHPSILATKLPKVNIRKSSCNPLPLSFYNCPDLVEIITNKKNLIISGKTGCGKTTLLNSIVNYINSKEHLIIIEDTYEIINQRKFQTNFLSKSHLSNNLHEFCHHALRLKPDRLIMGEIRSKEVIPFIMNNNTGHRGNIATLHANSASDSIDRLSTLFSIYHENSNIDYKTIKKLISKSLDYIVYMENKNIVEIIKVLGCNNGNLVYETVFSLE